MTPESLAHVRAERTRLRAVVEQFPSAAAVYEGPDHVFVAASEAYRRIVGGRDVVGRTVREVLPELEGQGFVAMLDRAFATGEPAGGTGVPAAWDSDGDGVPENFVIDFTYQPVRGPDGTVWGIVAQVSDVTDRHRAETLLQDQAMELEQQVAEAQALAEQLEAAGEELQLAQTQAEASRAQLARVLAQAPVAISVTRGPAHVFELANERYRALLGGRDPVGLPLRAVVPELEAQGIVGLLDEVVRSGRPFSATEMPISYDRRGSGEVEARFFDLVYHPLVGASGEVSGVVTVATDVSERVRSRAAEHEEQRRARFLAEAGEALAASLDYTATLRGVVEAAVPGLADWCALDMVVEPERGEWPPRVERLAVAHPDPARVAWAHELQERFPPNWDAPTGLPRVLRTGEPDWHPAITDEMLVAAARDDEELAILREVGFTSYLCVPLLVRGKALGALTLVMAESGRRYGDADLALARELARRAAAAVDNARLYAAERAARAAAERAAARVTRLQTVTAALGQALTAPEVATVVLREGIAALEAQVGAVYVAEAGEGSVELVAQQGLRDELLDGYRSIALDAHTPVTDVIRSGEPILSASAEMAARYPELWGATEGAPESLLQGWIALPLRSHGRVLGGVVFGPAEARDFGAEERDFVLALAQPCAQALERARLYEAERLAREAAEEANRAKTDFLSTMSHELRTPLNAIGGYVELLEMGLRGPVNEQQRTDLGRVKRAQEVLLGLISDVLNFARLDAGRVEYRADAVDVESLLDEMAPLMEPQLREAGLSYRLRAAPALRALGDRERMRQVLLNLLSNAVKFTPRGGRVEVAAAADDGRVRIAVSDTGRGISAEKLDAVFDPFVQVDRELTERSQQGVGLGLAISRELARGMGGDLEVESEPGRGSTFTLVLRAASDGADGSSSDLPAG